MKEWASLTVAHFLICATLKGISKLLFSPHMLVLLKSPRVTIVCVPATFCAKIDFCWGGDYE